MTITTRTGKGSPLTTAELDTNFTDLRDLKAPLASPTFTGTVAGVTKTHVGLGNVDNTADTSKPVSTAQQAAITVEAGKTTTVAGTSYTILASDNNAVVRTTSGSSTTITVNATPFLSAGFGVLRAGAGAVSFNGTATLTGDTPTLAATGATVSFIPTGTAGTYHVISGSASAATTYAALTDKTTVDLPNVNTPLGDVISAIQANIAAIFTALDSKQALLTSANLKTINGASLLGSGNIVVTGTAPPAQVTGLSAGTATSTTQPLSWSAPSGSPTTYLVEYRVSGSSSWLTFTHSTSTATSITVTGLTAATSYEYQVSGVNAGGPGTASSTVTASTAAVSGRADNFNRGNATTIGPPSDGGSGWSVIGGCGIASQQATPLPTGQGSCLALIETSIANGTFSIDVSGWGSDYPELIFRAVDANNYLFLQRTDNAFYQYGHVIAGVLTNVGSGAGGAVGVNTLSAVASGSSIIYKVNGTTIFSITETNFQTATMAGFQAFAAETTFDNFSAT